jgi:hypothetical protein
MTPIYSKLIGNRLGEKPNIEMAQEWGTKRPCRFKMLQIAFAFGPKQIQGFFSNYNQNFLEKI